MRTDLTPFPDRAVKTGAGATEAVVGNFGLASGFGGGSGVGWSVGVGWGVAVTSSGCAGAWGVPVCPPGGLQPGRKAKSKAARQKGATFEKLIVIRGAFLPEQGNLWQLGQVAVHFALQTGVQGDRLGIRFACLRFVQEVVLVG